MNTDIKMAEFSVAAAPVGGRYNFAIIRELDMKIKEIGIRVPVTISPFSSTDEAIHLMWTHDVRHLLVVDREGLAGMVTDGDLIESVGMLTLEERRAVGHPVTTEEVIVADVMDAEVPCVAPDDLVTDAIHRMLYLRRPALPVVDGTQILGAISESDLLQLFAGSCWLDRGTPHAEPVINYGSHVLKTIAPDDRLEAACVKLSLGKIRHLLVVEGEQFVGMITDWDIRRAIGQHKVGAWLDLPEAVREAILVVVHVTRRSGS